MTEIYIQTSTKDIRIQKTVKAKYLLSAVVNGQRRRIRVFRCDLNVNQLLRRHCSGNRCPAFAVRRRSGQKRICRYSV